MTEEQLREKVVSIAISLYGLNEADGSHRKIIDTYNSVGSGYKMTYLDPWCATTTSVIGIMANLSDIIFRECSCDRMITLYKNAGRWIEDDAYIPKKADIVFFDWSDNGIGDNTGGSDHVGMVVSVTGNTIKVIEGNMSNAVGYRTLQVNGQYIRGYGIPNYASKATTPSTSGSTGNAGNISSSNVNTGGNGKMKYGKNNKPLVCMQTNSTCYKGAGIMTVKGVLWHSTGANNPWLKRYVQPSDNASDKDKWLKLLGKNQYGNDWNHIYMNAGLNAWIGKLADGTVTTVQTMPWNYRPWGCGAGSKGSLNSSHIQFEIAEDSLNDKVYFDKVYKEACELTAYLCVMYNLDPYGTTTINGVKVPVILCHKDSYDLGMGSGHADVYHWFKKYGKTMDDVRRDVAALMKKSGASSTAKPSASTPSSPSASSEIYRIRKSWNDTKSQIGAYRNLKSAKDECDKAGNGYYVFNSAGKVVYPEPKFEPYKVKVLVDALNIRKGAGTNNSVVGTIEDNGTYTIIAEASGKGASKWGLLKGYQKYRNGWISLDTDYVKKI